MRHQQFSVSPIETYDRHGNYIPSVDRLESIYERLAGTSVVTTMLVVADVCLDLATHAAPELKDGWINKAEGHLDDVRSAAASLQDNDFMESYKKALPAVTLARLKQAELANWRRAVHGQAVQKSYDDYLAAALDSVPYFVHNPGIKSVLLEFAPLLLGARQQLKDSSAGWYGRLALHREDNRRNNMPNHRTNWDSGVSTQASSQDFLRPPIRLQSKSRQGGNGSQQYEKSNVRVINAAEVGIKDILKIMTGCFVEAGIVTRADISSIYEDPAEPAYLDECTGKIAEKGAILNL